jgi:lipoprotein-anchoring transpeptidase ErfK/SrfK
MREVFRKIVPLIALGAVAGCASAQAASDTTPPGNSFVRDSNRTTAQSVSAAPATTSRIGSAASSSSPASAKPAGNKPNRAAGPLRLEADISERQLHLYQGGELVKSYSVAVGTRKDPTPRGSYSIRKLVWNPGWVPPDEDWAKKKTAKAPGEKGNPMKVVKIFFREPDYYIHGTGETSSLGSAASHGCLRMAPSEAAELGQYIMEHGGQPRDESWFRRILRFRSQTKVVYLRSPVSMRITD